MDYQICDNKACDGDIRTAWGLAQAVFTELAEYGEFDGWNEYGNYNREYNKIPFSDFRDEYTRYTPVNDPWDIYDINRWQPLLESDELGFLYHQEHVTPHIGYTGKSLFFGDDYLCSKRASNPHYNYNKEMELALSRTANLTDTTKMEVESFDDKVASLFPLQGQYFERAQGLTDLDDWDLISVDVIIIALTYEATLLAWKEKAYWDAVRPPSIIHDQMAGEVKYILIIFLYSTWVFII